MKSFRLFVVLAPTLVGAFTFKLPDFMGAGTTFEIPKFGGGVPKIGGTKAQVRVLVVGSLV